MMKRKLMALISTLLVAALMFTALPGCKQSGKEGPGDSKSGQATGGEDKKGSDPYAKYAPAADKKYKISWAVSSANPIEKDSELVKYWNDKFNIELDIWEIDGKKYNELLGLKFASGEIPDKFQIIGMENFVKYEEQDILAEIPEEVLKKHAPDLYTNAEKDIPGIFKAGKIDGKLYGLPLTNANGMFRVPIVMRGDWLENLGIKKLPETLEEFESILYKFAKEDPDKNGQKDTYGLSKTALNAIYGAFGYMPEFWSDKGGKLVCGAVQPETKEALKLISKWYKDGVLDPEFITGENQGGYWAISHAFVNGRIGTSALGSYYHWKPASFKGDEEIGTYVELKKVNPKAAQALAYITPPKGPNGKSGMPQDNAIAASVIAFGKQLEKEPDKLGKILEIYNYTCGSSEENLITAVYGIKGKQWEKTDDGGIKRLTDKSPEVLGGNTLMFATVPPSIYFALYPGRIDFGKEKKLETGGIKNKLTGALPSASKYNTELNKIRDESIISIITGDKPIEYFDEFVEKWRKAGGEQLEKEANEWYAKQEK